METVRRFIQYMKYGNPGTAVIRIGLGAMFIYSGIVKELDPGTFAGVVERYNMVPADMAPYIAIILPVAEIVIGTCLVLGIRVRASALVSMALMVVFITGISVNLYRGETFDCGCFHLNRLGLDLQENISPGIVLRDLGIFFLFLYIFIAERHLFSIEAMRERLRLKNLGGLPGDPP